MRSRRPPGWRCRSRPRPGSASTASAVSQAPCSCDCSLRVALPQESLGETRAAARLTPGTDLDADRAAHRLDEVRDALVEINVPLAHAAHELLLLVDRAGRAVLDAAV